MIKIFVCLFLLFLIYLIMRIPKTIHVSELINFEQRRLKNAKAKDGIYYIYKFSKSDGTPDYRYRPVRMKVIGLNKNIKDV